MSERLFTMAEAGVVSHVPAKAVHNVIDKRLVPVEREDVAKLSKGRRGRKLLTSADLLKLILYYRVGSGMSPERRRRLFDEVAAKPNARRIQADEFVIVDLAAAKRSVAEGLKALEEAEAAVHVDKEVLGGEPVFEGTRVPVYSIAAMLEAGATREELLSGYPSLDARKIELAQIWAAAHPRRGRPKRIGAEAGLKLKSSRRVPLKADPRPATGAGANSGRR